MARETRVVGNWQPSKRTLEVIQTEFGQKLTELGLNEFLPIYYHQIRMDSEFLDVEVFTFHRDCGGGDQRFVVWSNVMPTEVQFATDGSMLETKDGDIILIDNLEVLHRSPATWQEQNARSRVFIRTTPRYKGS